MMTLLGARLISSGSGRTILFGIAILVIGYLIGDFISTIRIAISMEKMHKKGFIRFFDENGNECDINKAKEVIDKYM